MPLSELAEARRPHSLSVLGRAGEAAAQTLRQVVGETRSNLPGDGEIPTSLLLAPKAEA